MRDHALGLVGVCILVAYPFSPGRAQDKGTAVGEIVGQVVTDDSDARPVPRAIVSLQGAPIGERNAVTTDDGRFVFTDLGTGSFTITATKPGFVTTPFGATRPSGPRASIVIGDRAHVEVTIRLPRGAVLAGTIVNTASEPVPGISVSAIHVDDDNALKTVAEFETDDQGRYRIFGLAAGRYIVSAAPPLLSSLGNRVVEQPSAADLDALIKALTNRAQDRVADVLHANRVPAVSALASFASVYFPGVHLSEDATILALGTGEELTGLDFRFDPVPASTITGTVIAPRHGQRSVQLTLQSRGMARSSSLRSAAPAADGTFAFGGVPPGRYVILARAGPSDVPGTSTVRKNSTVLAETASVRGELLYAASDVEVNGVDVSVTLLLQPGGRISGRVRFEGSGRQGRSASDHRVVVFSTDRRDWRSPARQARFVRPSTDGKYDVPDLPPGEYFVTLVTRLEEHVLHTAAFLETLMDTAIRLRVGQGEHCVQHLQAY